MTITTLEEHDEAAQPQSEPSSPVLGLNSSGQQELNGLTDLFHEMKFEMRATKGTLPSPMHDRLKSGLPTSPLQLHGHTSNADRLSGGITRSQSSNIATNITGKPSIPRHQQPLQIKSTSNLPEILSNRLHDREASSSFRPANTVARSVPVDTADSASALSTRTRFRRQRRMGSQDSTEQSEDPMERLNRLRARISGALSEVKGVLNKYSTETEPNDEVNRKDPKSDTQTSQIERPKSDSGPIQFRFVKKVRRRSLFSDDEETKSDEVTIADQKKEASPKTDSMTTQPVEEEIRNENAEKKITALVEKVNEEPRTTKKATQVLPETIVPAIEIATPETVPSKTVVSETKSSDSKKETAKDCTDNSKPNKKLPVPSKNEKRRVSIAIVEEVDTQHVPQAMKTQRRPSDSVTVVKKFSKNDIKPGRVIDKILEKAPKKAQNEKTEIKTSVTKVDSFSKEGEKVTKTKDAALPDKNQKPLDKVKENTTPKVALPGAVQRTQMDAKETSQLGKDKNVKQQQKKPSPDDLQTAQTKSGKRLSVKKSDSFRRSSIAAVERSKIEPPITDSISPDLKMQRRPSDSEAILRKSTARSTDIRTGKSLTENKTPKTTVNDKHRVQTKRFTAEKTIEKTPTSTFAEPLVEKNTESLVANVENSRNSSKDDAMTPSAVDKQSVVMPNHSVTVINNETSIPSSMPVGASTATVIGRATTATATETATTPPANKTEISVATKDSKFPLISDGHEIANVAVPPSLSKINEASSQQAQLNETPITDSTSGISAKLLEKSIPPSTDNTVNKNVDPKREQQAVQAIQPLPTVPTNGVINHVAARAENTSSVGSERAEKQAVTSCSNDDIKKPIHQQEIIPATIKASLPSPSPSTSLSSPSPSPFFSQPSVQEALQQASAQQVSVNAELAVIATADDICVHDRVPEISETTPNKSLSEVNEGASSDIALVSKESCSTVDFATKTSAAAVTPDSGVENITTASVTSTPTASETEKQSNMPELQVLPVPVKALQVHPDSQASSPFGEPKEVFPKKKVIIKKVIRKSGTEKLQSPKPTDGKDQSEVTKESEVETATLPVIESTTTEVAEITDTTECPAEEENAVPPKSPRKVKKKVIIKRLQRRLSGSDQTFFVGPNDEKTTTDVETLEKTIAYVTDDEEDEEPAQTIEPRKSCMRIREYHIGDWVMYAERYKKTQLRWKRGRVIERITSISYKIDVDGKEVSAHINYLKRYTGRKVRFGGKEYLEIDYEQIAEEEEKARNYSIWNLV